MAGDLGRGGQRQEGPGNKLLALRRVPEGCIVRPGVAARSRQLPGESVLDPSSLARVHALPAWVPPGETGKRGEKEEESTKPPELCPSCLPCQFYQEQVSRGSLSPLVPTRPMDGAGGGGDRAPLCGLNFTSRKSGEALPPRWPRTCPPFSRHTDPCLSLAHLQRVISVAGEVTGFMRAILSQDSVPRRGQVMRSGQR